MKSKVYLIIKAIVVIFVVSCILGQAGITASAAEDQNSSKALYVVYDNSISMLENETWWQAAYAIETIRALMNDQDVMHIYTMSDNSPFYVKDFGKNRGISDAQEDVHESLRKMEYTDHTHKDGLLQAVEDIGKDSNPNKFLLIFSDGEFNYLGGKSNSDPVDLSNVLPKGHAIYYLIGSDDQDKIAGVDTVSSIEKNILETFTGIGNRIYDRQRLDFSWIAENKIELNLELPAKRLILIAESTEQVNADLDIKVDRLGNYDTVSWRKLQAGEMADNNVKKDSVENCFVTAKIYAEDALISPGTYTVTVPRSATVEVYVEYDVQFTVVLTEAESGKQWDLGNLGDAEPIREGDYQVDVRFVNGQNGKIIEDVTLYSNLDKSLYLVQDGEEISIVDGEVVHLKEGRCTIGGQIAVEGYYPKDISYEVMVRHHLGKLEMEIDRTDIRFDIDNVISGNESFYVQILEDRSVISGYDSLELSAIIGDGNPYTCRVDAEQGRWKITPELVSGTKVDEKALKEFELTITALGEKDGQQINCVHKGEISFCANPQDIEVQIGTEDVENAWDLYRHNSFDIVPVIQGKDINGNEWIEVKEFSVQLEDGSRMSADLRMSGNNPLGFVLRFSRFQWQKFWDMRNGGQISGTVSLEMERYGQRCVGTGRFMIIMQPVSLWILALAVAILVLGIYLFWLVVVKWIFRCKFIGQGVKVIYKANYGEDALDGKIFPKRFFHRYVGRPFSSTLIIPVEKFRFLGFSSKTPKEVVIRRKFGGRFVIVNIEEFVDNSFVLMDGKPIKGIDAFFQLHEGINLTFIGDICVDIKIYSEDM